MGLTVSWRESSCPHRPVQPVTPCRSALMSLRASSSLRTCANRVKWEALSISPLQRKSWSGVIERLWDKSSLAVQLNTTTNFTDLILFELFHLYSFENSAKKKKTPPDTWNFLESCALNTFWLNDKSTCSNPPQNGHCSKAALKKYIHSEYRF